MDNTIQRDEKGRFVKGLIPFSELPTIKMVGFKREYEGNSSQGKSLRRKQ